ncbi:MULTISPECIES: TIR domain-containing protein [Stenotrophomonas]|uniref:TIR domain-containing protein n=1 Tax=Stenotrophomonas TaxID=40323 RepID=UPI0008DE6B8D|nr:TIR domain-containing protein [Stenotrophomonas maltophilia]OHY71085.1 hypothetical protein BB780_06825 [Stenotrophomonas maltophilia]HEL4845749.1 TIR domain-containing protein [Stenotrophomonas maltophilia]
MLRVFISYASDDRERVLPYFERLRQQGFSPWIDQLILPGQSWELEITRNFKSANAIIIFMSARSVTKRGFVQREAKDALELMRNKLHGDIFIIPVLLEDCEVPDQISDNYQHIDLNVEGAWDQVVASLKLAAQQQSVDLADGATHGPFKVFTEEVKEEWKGRPGHDIEVSYPRFESETHQDAARELSQLFAGRAARTLIHARQRPWEQNPEFFEEGAGNAFNGRWDHFSIELVNDEVLSLHYSVGWYGAGAAHPNTHFESYNFYINGRVTTMELSALFTDSDEALKRISAACIQQLSKEYWERTAELPEQSDIESFRSGAGEEWENFQVFTISRNGLRFLFHPYQVHAYAMGSWGAEVSFYDLLDLLPADGIHVKLGHKSLAAAKTLD